MGNCIFLNENDYRLHLRLRSRHVDLGWWHLFRCMQVFVGSKCKNCARLSDLVLHFRKGPMMNSPSLDKNNPYSAPGSNLDADHEAEGRRFVQEGIAVGSDRVVGWFGRAFEFFKASALQWALTAFIFFVILFILNMIPLVNMLTNIIFPIFFGGLMLGCYAQAHNQEFTVGHLFAGFQSKAGPLALVGLFYFILMIVVMIAMGILMIIVIGGGMGIGSILGAATGNKQALASMFAGGFGLGMLLMIPLIFVVFTLLFWTVYFAPVLVVLHDLSPLDAMVASFNGCRKNWVNFILYGIIYIVLAIVATIPIGLGWFVLGPVIIASIYTSYEDVFLS